MAKENKRKKKINLSAGRFFEQASLTIIGISFIIFGFFAVFDNKISANGSFLRGVGWEAEGIPAIGIALFIVYFGAIIIFYTFRK